MAVVNLGYPVMLLMTAIETLCGSGGSTCYALLLGERKGEEAGKVLFLSLAAALLAGLALMAAGMLFPDRLAGLLCRDAALVEAGFGLYLRVLVLSAPVLVAVLTMVSFLPSGGSPNLAMVLNLVAFSIVAVFYGGAIGAAQPILAFLHGQRDFSGRQHILKTALACGLAPVLLCVAWFEAAPGQLAALYNITAPEELAVAVAGLVSDSGPVRGDASRLPSFPDTRKDGAEGFDSPGGVGTQVAEGRREQGGA